MANPKIREALTKLDPKNDAHWTTEGTPRLETVRLLTGDNTITREDITKENQGFTREMAIKAAAAPPAAPDASATPAPPKVPPAPPKAPASPAASNGPTGAPSKPIPAAPLKPAETGPVPAVPGTPKFSELELDPKAALPLKADGSINPNAPATVGMIGGSPTSANSKPAGTMTAPDGKTLNPTAESNNQPGKVMGDSDEKKLEDYDDDEDPALEGDIKASEQENENLTKKLEDTQREIAEHQNKMALLYAQRKASGKPEHLRNMEAIQQFLGGEQRKRDERGGVKPDDKAPIDKSLQNRPRPKQTV